MCDQLEQLNAKLLAHKEAKHPTLAFYLSKEPQDSLEYVQALLKFMQDQGFYAVLLFSDSLPRARDFCNSTFERYHISCDHLKSIQNLDLLLLHKVDPKDYTKETCDYPKETKVLAIFDINMLGSGANFWRELEQSLSVDAYLVSMPLDESQDQVKKLWTNFFEPNLYQRESKEFALLSCGYQRGR